MNFVTVTESSLWDRHKYIEFNMNRLNVSLRAVIATWLNGSQRSIAGVGMPRGKVWSTLNGPRKNSLSAEVRQVKVAIFSHTFRSISQVSPRVLTILVIQLNPMNIRSQPAPRNAHVNMTLWDNSLANIVYKWTRHINVTPTSAWHSETTPWQTSSTSEGDRDTHQQSHYNRNTSLYFVNWRRLCCT